MSEGRRYGPYTVSIGRADKVLYPDVGITKGDVVDYYDAVAGDMLRHVADRPLTLQRFPDGVGEEGFYQKRASEHFPDWVPRVEVPLAEGGTQTQVVARNAATLAYLAGQGTLAFHPWLSRIPALENPDTMIFDLDPPDGGDFGVVREAGLRLREVLEALGLAAVVMTTGSSGAHVRAPLRTGPDFDTVRGFARRIADHLAARFPDRLTTEARKKKRLGRLYLDVARNARGQTAVAPYSLRARPGAPVAAPLTWDEFRRIRDARRHTLRTVPGRLRERGDPWSGVGRSARDLAGAVRRAEEVLGPAESL
ncbi:MAG TPA: non-homologous end-joining DNA ligase [Longimicrobiales bacterium]|nr:non-homologous end-joining DNA ligase [Longimicrobiales bacterium]